MASIETTTVNAKTYAIQSNATATATYLLYTETVYEPTTTSVTHGFDNVPISKTLYGPIGPTTLTSSVVSTFLPESAVSSSGSAALSSVTTTQVISTTSSNSGAVASTTSNTNSTPSQSGVAATTTSGIPSPSPSTGAGTDNVGAIAGAAIGGLVGGALIAALIAWFIMSRRQKKRSSGYGERERRHTSHLSNEKALPSAPLLGGVVGNWEKHLDQPESDATITRSIKGLFDHIEMHVENFYRDASIPLTDALTPSLMALKSSRDLPDEIPGLLSLTDRPTLLIKHCLAYAIVEHIDFESGAADSFLPADLTALPTAMMTRSRSTSGKPAFHQAFSRWRVLTAYLRPTPSSDPTYTSTRDAHIAALADTLCRTFDPWALSRDNFPARKQNLADIMKVGAETGCLLFAQPGGFRWRWGSRGGSGGGTKGGKVGIVVLPGCEKVRDEEARELERGVWMVRPVEGWLVG